MSTAKNPSSPLALGFIGGGMSSAIGSAHFAASMLDRRFEVVSGCFSRDAEVSRRTAARWHIDAERCSNDWREYLARERERLDAVAVLTPIPDHRAMIEAALALELPVISEKALVADTAEATAIIEAQRDRRHFLAVTLNYSGYPVVRLLRRLVAEGRFGELHQIHLEMPLENYLRHPLNADRPAAPQGWRQRDRRIPTLLLDLGVHLHHLLHVVTGAEPRAVMAKLNRFSAIADRVDDARVWAECDTGLQASLWMSKTALGHRNGLRLRLFGERGSAEWYQCEPEILHVTDVHGTRSQLDRGVENEVLGTARYNRFKAGHPSGYVEAFGNLYWDIADALEDYRRRGRWTNPNVFGAEHARQGLAFLEAAVAADASRRWCPVATFSEPLAAAA